MMHTSTTINRPPFCSGMWEPYVGFITLHATFQKYSGQQFITASIDSYAYFIIQYFQNLEILNSEVHMPPGMFWANSVLVTPTNIIN